MGIFSSCRGEKDGSNDIKNQKWEKLRCGGPEIGVRYQPNLHNIGTYLRLDIYLKK